MDQTNPIVVEYSKCTYAIIIPCNDLSALARLNDKVNLTPTLQRDIFNVT